MLSKIKIIVLLYILFAFTFVAGVEAFACFIEGDKGQAIMDIQKGLKNKKVYNAEITGVFDDNTAAAVIKWQKTKKIKSTGIVDDVLYKELTGKEYKGVKLDAKTKAIIETAFKYIGTPYVFGGTTPKGFDCSGYVQYVFKQNKIDIPRLADEEYNKTGKKVERKKLQPGDLVFFTTYEKGPSHVGIYIGDDKFINATSSSGVKVCRVSDPYYWGKRYFGAKRVL